jgi:hypothetical protein
MALALAACAGPASTTMAPTNASGVASPGASASPVSSAAPAASAGTIFRVDGVDSASSGQVAVDTFRSTKVALNFGIQALSAPTDYTLLLTFSLDAAKTGSGTYDETAVNQVEALLRDAKTGAVYKSTWRSSKSDGSSFKLSVSGDRITASWKGAVAGAATKQVEAAVEGLSAAKK